MNYSEPCPKSTCSYNGTRLSGGKWTMRLKEGPAPGFCQDCVLKVAKLAFPDDEAQQEAFVRQCYETAGTVN